jgi:hypothetical protein
MTGHYDLLIPLKYTLGVEIYCSVNNTPNLPCLPIRGL